MLVKVYVLAVFTAEYLELLSKSCPTDVPGIEVNFKDVGLTV